MVISQCLLYLQFKLLTNSELILQKKATVFKIFFEKQCNVADSNSQLPDRAFLFK